MRRAREIWPDAVIDVLGYERTMGMLAGNLDVDAVIESPEHPRWPEYRELIKRIFRQYDLAIVAQPSDRAHIYGLLAAPTRVGIVSNRFAHNWWKKLVSLRTVEIDYWQQHVVIERLRLLQFAREEHFRNDGHEKVSVLPPSRESLPRELAEFVLGHRSVVIHATPMWRFKRWPVDHWADLVVYFLESGRRVILTGSSSHQDLILNGEIMGRLSSHPKKPSLASVRNFAGALNLGQTCELVSVSDVYVGVDTSITHLAAACGVRTFALFGATPPTNFGPWPYATSVQANHQTVWSLRGDESSDGSRGQTLGNVTIIQGPGDCVPCRRAGCLDKFESHSDCLDRLSPEAVISWISRAA